MIESLIIVCLVTYIFGYFLTKRLFKQKNKQFTGSEVQKKIYFWIPIFLLVVISSFQILIVNSVILLVIITGIFYDFRKHKISNKNNWISIIYVILVTFGVVALFRISMQDLELFLAVWYISVISDVAAYFIGNFFGKSKLPAYLNSRKSWQGVAGQIFGAFIGWMVFNAFISDIPILLVAIVGLGCAIGDLFNSYIKRKIDIKDWSKAIPGHGGYLDRLSSLSVAALITLLGIKLLI